MSTEVQQPFNPNNHLSKLRGKNGDYLEVKWRLVWFRDQCERGEITTEVVHLDLEKGVAVFKATASDGQGGIATGHGSETKADFGDYLEKAETKAIGRALAALGYGTQFAPELEEGDRIVDSPVARTVKPAQPKATPGTEHLKNGDGTPAFPAKQPDALEQAIAQVKKEFEAIYPDYVAKSSDWFERFQQSALGEVPAQLESTHVAKLRGWLSKKQKTAKPAEAVTSGKE